MSVKQTSVQGLNRWVDALAAKHPVFGVTAKGGRFAYERLSAAAELRLDYDVTILPPKKYFLPQVETLLTYNAKGEYQSCVDVEPFVLFGVHPYDLVALNQLDAIFEKDNPDAHYLTRRKSATIVACDVQTPSEHIFAGCMGTATAKDGFDILLTRVGEQYVVDVRTAKGRALLADLAEAKDADAAVLARREQVWQDAERFLKMHRLQVRPEDLPALLSRKESYHHPIWQQKAAACYSCGSCNLVCPTCYCFDVQDKLAWQAPCGQRERRWDGCLLCDFAVVAGNHNFRKLRADRYRHRYYRKGKYLWDRMGQIACVGCGRCIAACTTKIANPVEIYNALNGGKQA